MTLIYATVDDYATWTDGTVPDNAASLLRSASLLVFEQTQAAFYDTDTTGAPTSAPIIAAFRDATCAQSAVWAGLNVDPNLSGLDVAPPKRSKGIGTARIDYDTSVQASVTAFTARQKVIASLCPQAQQILRQAGVLSTRVWTYG